MEIAVRVLAMRDKTEDAFLDKILEIEGVEVCFVGEKTIEAYDVFNGRDLVFNRLDKLDFTTLIDFMGTDIDKSKAIGVLSKVDPALFMGVGKISIVGTEADYEAVIEELGENDPLEDECIGKTYFFENHLVVSQMAIDKVVEELIEQGAPINPVSERNIGFWTTILHELRHSMQQNPLYEEAFGKMEMLEMEDDAEGFALACYEKLRVETDCMVMR